MKKVISGILIFYCILFSFWCVLYAVYSCTTFMANKLPRYLVGYVAVKYSQQILFDVSFFTDNTPK